MSPRKEDEDEPSGKSKGKTEIRIAFINFQSSIFQRSSIISHDGYSNMIF